jgi:predicted outer membrane repeat protein
MYFSFLLFIYLDCSLFGNTAATVGGAIYSVSERESVRMIVNCGFGQPITNEAPNGIDIFDNSTITYSIYTKSSVVNSTTGSQKESGKSYFYSNQSSAPLDCLLIDGCNGDMYVNALNGQDFRMLKEFLFFILFFFFLVFIYLLYFGVIIIVVVYIFNISFVWRNGYTL